MFWLRFRLWFKKTMFLVMLKLQCHPALTGYGHFLTLLMTNRLFITDCYKTWIQGFHCNNNVIKNNNNNNQLINYYMISISIIYYIIIIIIIKIKVIISYIIMISSCFINMEN